MHDCELYNTGLSGTGEGLYLGCNYGDCSVSDSLFEYNYLHDLGGSQGDGIEIKTGSWGNTVRGNVIVGANYPAITLYGFADGLGPRNVVEGNFVWGTLDNGIQVVGQVIVRNNIVVDAGVNGIHSKASQGDVPHAVEIVHNTVYAAGAACMKTNDWDSLAGQVLANNAFYCPGGIALSMVNGPTAATLTGNVTDGAVSAPGGYTPGVGPIQDLGDPDNLVLWPPSGSALVDAGVGDDATVDDFNGSPRTDGAADAGAYERTAATNPGWTLQAGFKPRIADDQCTGGDLTIAGPIVFTGQHTRQSTGRLATSGTVTVAPEAWVRFEAASAIRLAPGFQVEAGGQLSAVIDVVICVP